MFNELTTREKARLSIKMLHSVVIRIRLKSSASVFLPIQSSLCPALEVFFAGQLNALCSGGTERLIERT